LLPHTHSHSPPNIYILILSLSSAGSNRCFYCK
jgi:hypothetical protein